MTTKVYPNRITPEGWQLGKEVARLVDKEAATQGRDGRCWTCAARAGDHLANGSPATLMSLLKCAAEREPFWCHERDEPCRGWLLMRAEAGEEREMPWSHIGGVDE